MPDPPHARGGGGGDVLVVREAPSGVAEGTPTVPIPQQAVKPKEPRRDVFGFVVENEDAYQRWAGTDEQKRFFEKVANVGGWRYFLWAKGVETLEWYGDDTYYENLLWISQKRRGLKKHHPGVIAAYDEIERDIPRTFPGHALAARVHEDSRKILQAYALRNPSVGYCQGMNYLAAILGKVTSDEQAFWLLAYIVECLVPDYYKGLQGVFVDLQVLEKMIERLEPRLWSHLSSIGFTCASVFSQYLVCLFAYGMPAEAVLQLWGTVFKAPHPRVQLLRVACGLMRLLKADLLSCTAMHEVVLTIQAGCSSLYNAQRLIDVAGHSEELLPSSLVLRSREELASDMMRRSKMHREKLESVQRAKLQRELIEQIRAGWRGEMDDLLTKDDLRELVKETGINPDIEDIILWEKESVPFREVLFSLLLLQEGGIEEKFRTANSFCTQPGDGNPGSLALASQMSTMDPNLALAISMEDVDDHLYDSPPQSPTSPDTPARPPRPQSPSAADPSADDASDGSGELVVLSNGEIGKAPRRPRRPRHADPLADSSHSQAGPDLSTDALCGGLSRPNPVPDGDVLLCSLCSKEFKWYRRKHHCRACGQVICNACSPNRVPIPILNYHVPVRVCVACEQQMTRHESAVDTPTSLNRSPHSFAAYAASPTSSEGVAPMLASPH